MVSNVVRDTWIIGHARDVFISLKPLKRGNGRRMGTSDIQLPGPAKELRLNFVFLFFVLSWKELWVRRNATLRSIYVFVVFGDAFRPSEPFESDIRLPYSS